MTAKRITIKRVKRADRRPTRSRPPRASAPPESPPSAESPWVQLRSGTSHPFIYSRMIRSADPQAKPGDVVTIYDKSGSFFGRGLYNPRSLITLRLLSHDAAPVDDAFWRSRLERAAALRRKLRLDEVSDAYRLVHAEGDGLSGVVVERYADCLVFEVFSLGMYLRWRLLARHLAGLLAPDATPAPPATTTGGPWRWIVRADEFIEKTEGFRVDPALRADVGRLIIREHGIRYRVDPAAGHKTGFFCDQRDNRLRFSTLCRDATILDVCCYTGGFGLCGKLLGPAREVCGVDLDEKAIALARENANLNHARIDFVQGDAFTYLRQMIANGRQFDAVALDPPKLAESREGLDEALRKYSDLNALALQVVRDGGLIVTCSCSGLVSREAFKGMVFHAARRARVSLQVFAESGAAPDHPVMMNCPESEYLKLLWARVLRS